MAGELARGLQLQGGYTHFRRKDSAGLPLDTEQPVRLFKLFASYRLPAMPRLTLTAGMRWQSRTFESRRGAPISARHIIDSYAIWNAGLRYDFSDRVNLSLLVSKLTDKTYRVSTSTHTYGPRATWQPPCATASTEAALRRSSHKKPGSRPAFFMRTRQM